MPNYVSPGVFVIEKDISQYAPTVNSSVVGVVGFASKGPVNKATLVTSPNQLIDTFGPPNENITGQGLEGSIEILEQTNSMYYVRAAGSNAANASSTVTIGACPAIQVSALTLGVASPVYLRLQVTDNAGVSKFSTAKTYSVPTGTGSGGQAQAIQSIVGGSLDSAHVGCFFDSTTSTTGYLAGSYAGSGTSLSVCAYSNVLMTDAYGLSCLNSLDSDGAGIAPGGALASSSVTAYGSTFIGSAASGVSYQVQSLYPGAGYNAGTKANGDTSGNSVEIKNLAGPYVNLVVNEDGVAKENFKVSLVANSDFVEDKINTGSLQNLKSNTIQGSMFFSGSDAVAPVGLTSFISQVSNLGMNAGVLLGTSGPGGTQETMNPRFAKMVAKTINMTAGDNGIPALTSDQNTALIGDAAVDPKTGMQSLDDEVLNISLAIVPGITAQTVQNALITLAESTQAFLAVVSPPYAVGTVQNAIDWSNGQTDTRTASISSNYAAIYWPWVQTFSVNDAKDRWYDPGIFGIRQMVHTDSVSDPWFAPAGFIRGRLTKPTDTEVKLNQGDRDSMYSGGNVLNPIVNFVRQGITIFGQRTAQRNPTALDRINVRRLLIQIRKVILESTRQFVFEPNDEFTWAQIESVLNPFLDDIKRRRGITQFRVVCDETTNTPARVDRNELWCKVLIKPTKTAEILIFEVNLTNQSAQLGGA
tara:strand:- start:1272 stop:3371 length:2100 start_codon:yes stop_codon:yes gene_type:complete